MKKIFFIIGLLSATSVYAGVYNGRTDFYEIQLFSNSNHQTPTKTPDISQCQHSKLSISEGSVHADGWEKSIAICHTTPVKAHWLVYSATMVFGNAKIAKGEVWFGNDCQFTDAWECKTWQSFAAVRVNYYEQNMQSDDQAYDWISIKR